MHLIWYNSISKKYEYGSSTQFRTLKSKSEEGEALTTLMEFPGDDRALANKIIGELNIANEEPVMVV